jgi:hypothetical protein
VAYVEDSRAAGELLSIWGPTGSSSKQETRIFQQDTMDLPETRAKEHR